MPYDPKGPHFEAVLERTVRQHTHAAARNASLAFNPLRSRKARFRHSEVYRALEELEAAAERAEAAVARWSIRTAPQLEVFDETDPDEPVETRQEEARRTIGSGWDGVIPLFARAHARGLR